MRSIPITIHGNLTRDPELRFGKANGTPWVTFTLARNPSVKNDRGEWEDGPSEYFNCKAFNSLAANIADSVSKGDRLLVVGTLTLRPYEHEGVTKISADVDVEAAGPSLQWATATVVKNTKGNAGPAPTPDTGYVEGEEPF